MTNLTVRYTSAWCSQNSASVATFFAPDGWLKVNDNPPAVGRDAIAALAQSFMTAFPDLHLTMYRLDANVYHWTLTGTGANGKKVRISGYEEWTLKDGLIAASRGHFDFADYERQLA